MQGLGLKVWGLGKFKSPVLRFKSGVAHVGGGTGWSGQELGCRGRSLGLWFRVYWLTVKELKLSCHNGYIW